MLQSYGGVSVKFQKRRTWFTNAAGSNYTITQVAKSNYLILAEIGGDNMPSMLQHVLNIPVPG